MDIFRVRSLRCLCAVVSTVLALAVPATAMADLITLKLPGVTGDVTVPGQKGTIEVLSITGNVQRPEAEGTATGGAGSGKVVFTDLMIHKRFDTSSPALFLAVASGKHFPNAVLTLLQNATTGQLRSVFTITLTEVLLTRFGTNATEPHVLAGPEQIALNFSKIELKDDVTGTTACWDRVANRSC